ncbi:uncharacterized protein [Physeter macrocephalus]|uniref:DNA-directed RNA polymerase subunit n=1 Tax=Physeter macrocephalus TaxID=9755 RepID=A0A9W2WJD4_PHYMC|nr:uncharacterized protein LOC102979717 isoform X2 [Physeter catodon]
MDRCVASWCHRRVSMPVSENRHWKAQATPAGAALPHGLLITDVLASFPVHFRYVVFHPFLDEILIGNIKGCSPDGVHVSLGFFDDILIPPESLQQPAKFDEAEQVWVWEYETEEGAHDLYMDTGEEIRFRVVDESFVDTSPTGPSSADAASSSEELPKKEAPYTLVYSRKPRASCHFPTLATPGTNTLWVCLRVMRDPGTRASTPSFTQQNGFARGLLSLHSFLPGIFAGTRTSCCGTHPTPCFCQASLVLMKESPWSLPPALAFLLTWTQGRGGMGRASGRCSRERSSCIAVPVAALY